MSFFTLPYQGDIRIGSRVRYGDLDWVVSRIEVRHYTPLPYLSLKPPKNRPGKNCSLTVTNVLIDAVELLP